MTLKRWLKAILIFPIILIGAALERLNYVSEKICYGLISWMEK